MAYGWALGLTLAGGNGVVEADEDLRCRKASLDGLGFGLMSVLIRIPLDKYESKWKERWWRTRGNLEKPTTTL